MYAPLLREMPQGALLCDLVGVIEWANSAAGELLGLSPQDLRGCLIEEVLGSAGGELSPSTYRHAFVDQMGKRRWLQRSVSTVPVEVGQPNLSLQLLSDITEFDKRRPNRLAVNAGIEAGRIDPRTGLLNRLAIFQELTAEISRSRRYANPLGAIMVRFSDCAKLDPPAVKAASTRELVSQCINAGLRWVDSVGALDEGTLLVVLPETEATAIEQVSHKLETLCQDIALPSPSAELAYRVSHLAWSKELDADGAVAKLAACAPS